MSQIQYLSVCFHHVHHLLYRIEKYLPLRNTRCTDTEILEKRFPIIVRRFTIRPNTGGNGLYNGGNGIHRELQFRRSLTLSILSERRALPPWGASGGSDGARGKNLLQRYHHKNSNEDEDDGDDGDNDSNTTTSIKFISVGGRATLPVYAGDIFHLLTPGGGGWGDINITSTATPTTTTSNDGDTLPVVSCLSGASLATLAATEADF